MRFLGIVLCGFACAWAIAALLYAGAPVAATAVPMLVSVALVAFVWNRPSLRPPTERRRIGRIILWASCLEGVAILAGVNIVALAGRPELATTVVAAVVGLHFLPLARMIPVRLYYAAGTALVALAAFGLALVPPVRNIVVCSGSALVLYLTFARLAFVYRPGAYSKS